MVGVLNKLCIVWFLVVGMKIGMNFFVFYIVCIYVLRFNNNNKCVE